MAIRPNRRNVFSVDFTKAPSLLAQLRNFARREDLSVGQVIRRACRDWLVGVKTKTSARS